MSSDLLTAWRSPLDAVSDLIAQGGPFVVWIFLCGLLMWTLVKFAWPGHLEEEIEHRPSERGEAR